MTPRDRARVAIGAALVVALLVSVSPKLRRTSRSEDPSDVGQIFDQTNAQRAANRLPALARDPQLMEAARMQSHNQADLDTMGHYLPVKGEESLADRANKAGYLNWLAIGENVAGDFPADKVVDAWMSSAGHRRNILGDFDGMGVGIAKTKEGKRYYAQAFGKKR